RVCTPRSTTRLRNTSSGPPSAVPSWEIASAIEPSKAPWPCSSAALGAVSVIVTISDCAAGTVTWVICIPAWRVRGYYVTPLYCVIHRYDLVPQSSRNPYPLDGGADQHTVGAEVRHARREAATVEAERGAGLHPGEGDVVAAQRVLHDVRPGDPDLLGLHAAN